MSFGRILMHYINIYIISFVHGVPRRFVMCFTNDYSKIYVYGIIQFSILISFINVYSRI